MPKVWDVCEFAIPRYRTGHVELQQPTSAPPRIELGERDADAWGTLTERVRDTVMRTADT